jgi:uncharacterized protein YbaP (TraB family)
MYRLYFTVLLALVLVASSSAFAQRSRPEYTLLWKITGKDLSAPSYLFGTMHLKDKRVYSLSDSVLVKLNVCRAFAMEIHPDSVLGEVFSEIFKSDTAQTSNPFRNVLSAREYDELDKQLQKEAGISLERLKNKSPRLINLLINKKLPEAEDKPTFLDGHLYYLARLAHKKVIGLEFLNEQLPEQGGATAEQKLEEIKQQLKKNYQKQSMDQLIALYRTGNAEELFRYVHGNASPQDPVIQELAHRNHTMTGRIVQHIHQQSTFIAVGAAHLAGQEGIVRLLQQKGYTVTPVKATFAGLADRYVVDPRQDTWRPFTPEGGAFSVDIPSAPYLYQYDKTFGLTMHIYPDLGTGMVYYVMSMGIPAKADAEAKDRLLKEVVDNMVKQRGVKQISERKISLDGNPGREVKMSSLKDRESYRARVYLRESSFYVLMAGGNSESLTYGDADRFFQSFRLLEYQAAAWKEFSSKEEAFKVRAPGVFKKSITTTPAASGKKNILSNYVVNSESEGCVYMISHVTFPPGFVIQGDSSYFNTIIKSLVVRFKGKVRADKDISVQGFVGKDFEIDIPDEGMIYRSRIILRDNRPYMLAAVFGQGTASTSVQSFFDSFAFTPLPDPTWQKYTAPDEVFSVQLPATPEREVDSAAVYFQHRYGLQTRYFTSDPASALPFFVHHGQFDSFYFVPDEKTLFQEMLDDVKSEKDSVWQEKPVKVGQYTGRDYILGEAGHHLLRRVRIVVRESDFFRMITYSPEKEMRGTVSKNFLESLQFPSVVPKQSSKEQNGSIWERKTDRLLRQLTDSDSLTRRKANRSLESYRFMADELPKLYLALERSYADDTLTYSATRDHLLTSLMKLPDSATIDFLGRWYPSISHLPHLQEKALSSLISLKTPRSIHLTRQLLTKQAPSKSSGRLFYSLNSLPLVREMLPSLLALASNAEWKAPLYRFLGQALDSSWVAPGDLQTMKPLLLADTKSEIARRKAVLPKGTFDKGEYKLANWIHLLAGFTDDPESVSLLKSCLDDRSTYVAHRAGVALVRRGIIFDKKKLNRIAAAPQSRLALYQDLQEENKGMLFPAKYRTQVHFAEGSLIQYLNEYEETYPDEVQLVSHRKVAYKGKKGIAYLYKIKGEDENGKTFWYAGICGMFPMDKKKLEPDAELTRIAYENFSKRSVNQHFEFFLTPPSEESEEDVYNEE